MTSIVPLPRHTPKGHVRFERLEFDVFANSSVAKTSMSYYHESNVKSSWKSLFWVHMSVFFFCMFCGCVWVFCIFYANKYLFVCLQTREWFSLTNRSFNFPSTHIRFSNHFALSVLLMLNRIYKNVIWWVILPLLTCLWMTSPLSDLV